MSRQTGKRRSAQLFTTLEQRTAAARNPPLQEAAPLPPEALMPVGLPPSADGEDQMLDLTSVASRPILPAVDTSRTLRMKKFRSQLLHQWLIHTFEPCRAADVGGGKGLISHLLIQSGWQSAVIDPFSQPLPDKYKDILSGTRVKVDPAASVPRIDGAFEVEMAADFDLLIGMHAHACNAKIIDAAQRYGCGFVIFPCCVIDEPFFPRLGVQWIECLADYALFKGLEVFPFRLNFKGQNIGLCHVGRCERKR